MCVVLAAFLHFARRHEDDLHENAAASTDAQCVTVIGRAV